MLSRMFFGCLVLVLALLGSGSSFSCRWMDHKFRQHSETSLLLLDSMETAEDAGTEGVLVPFPDHLYHQTSRASAEEKLAFTVQVLREVCALFEEDHSAASWEETTLDNFLNVLNKQVDELSSCIVTGGHSKRTKKLHMYFNRLSHHVLHSKGHSAVAWELVRKEVRLHLMRVDQLASSAL